MPTYLLAMVVPHWLSLSLLLAVLALSLFVLPTWPLDGDLDLVCVFPTVALNLTVASTEATLTGETSGTTPIFGADSVIVRACDDVDDDDQAASIPKQAMALIRPDLGRKSLTATGVGLVCFKGSCSN